MSNQKNKIKKVKKQGIMQNSILNSFILILTILLAYSLVFKMELENSVEKIMLVSIMLIVFVGGYKYIQGFDKEVLLKCIIIIGFIMRIGYMLYTPCNVRPHDVNGISITSNGHAAYILNILEGHLPQSNIGQFYHPPLFHILSAVVITILRPILDLKTDFELINSAKLVSCIFSCLTLCTVKSICEELKINKLIPVTLVAFLPNLYLMGGRVNNDAIAMFFMAIVLLYSIKWYKEQNAKNTIILALGFGFGMMSKMSVALLAVPTGLLMLFVLFKSFKGQTIKMLCLFALISIPLGLAYPVRNLILFDQPFNYILNLENAGFASEGYSIAERFLSFPINKLFNPVYNNVWMDYNIWNYILKGGLFGEFIFDITKVIPIIMLGLFFLINLYMVVAAGYALRPNKENKDSTRIWYFLVISAVMIFISFIVFNIKYPYGCTMDYRYIALIYVINALFCEKFTSEIKEKQTGRLINKIFIVLVIIFSILSVCMFCLI